MDISKKRLLQDNISSMVAKQARFTTLTDADRSLAMAISEDERSQGGGGADSVTSKGSRSNAINSYITAGRI